MHVTDTGHGMTSRDLERLFVPFERLGAAATGVEGTGLGLSISRHLSAAMAGTPTACSQPGHGSTFTLALPTADFATAAVDAPSIPTAADSGRDHSDGVIPIVYVEDNLQNAELVDRILTQVPDTTVTIAPDAAVGMSAIREHRPRLILLDLGLPGLDGEQTLRELKSDPDVADIPVVILSADATHGQIRKMLELGAVEYLTKPFDIPNFMQVVDDILAPTSKP